MMKKRLSALLLAVCMAATLVSVPAGAVSLAADGGEVQTIRALGILEGDANGNLNLEGSVTRAQFAKMLVNASAFKDSVGAGEGVSLFKDVKSDHWASQYIKIAVEQGWMTGYSDGSFRPGRTITLEQGCTTVLRLLGYDSTTLVGSFPSAQLSKAASLGLRDQITLSQGGLMTRGDCVQLFYNALTAQTSEKQTYAATLGYTVTNGQVDYAGVVGANLSGPFVAAGQTLDLPFAQSAATVYLNGAASSLSAVQEYTVYYYNAGMQTVWLYTDRAGGVITALSPSAAAPTSVTIGATEYPIGASTAAYKLSAMGEFQVGDTALCLLGMNGEVVDVVSGGAASTVYYGVVTSIADDAQAAGSAAATVVKVDVACTDGTVHSFSVEKRGSFSVGSLVSVGMTDGGTTIKGLSAKPITGKVDSAGTALGERKFAANVEILDTSNTGAWARIYPSRLAGAALDSSDVRYYVTNTAGEITHLILDDATGDTWSFYYLTSVPVTEDGSRSGSFSGLTGGGSSTLNTNGKAFSAIQTGGAAVRFATDGTVKDMRQMQRVALTSLSTFSAMGGNTTYPLDPNVQVYLRKKNSGAGAADFYPVSLGSINTADYTVTGWVDNFGGAAGGRVRILIAVEK